MSRGVSAADLDAALVLETPQRVPDGGGGWEVSWLPLGTLWASMRAAGASEREHGARAYGRITHRVVVRAAAPQSPRRPRADQRLLARDRVLNVLAVAEAETPGFLVCWCEEGPLS